MDDEILSAFERGYLLMALYSYIVDHAGGKAAPPHAIALARKLEGVDKRIIVRTMR